jgi:hypothetical protein
MSSSRYTASQQDAIRRDNRAMEAAAVSMVTELDDLFALVAAGSIGITAAASDVDSLALGGGAFTANPNTTSGLTFGYSAGRFHNGKSLVSVGAGTVALSASATNYVEVDRAGTVSANTSAFTAGRLPLWVIVTGVGAISSVMISKPLMTLIGLAGVTGDMLSSAGATKSVEVALGDLAATTAVSLICPAFGATLARVSFVSKTAVTADDTNYWTWSLKNKGAAGTGTTDLLDTTATNTTKATGGTATVAYVRRLLALTGTGANLATAAEDVLELTVTKTASATTMAQCTVRLDFTFTA